MSIVDPHFTMPGADMPPQEFKDLKTQQGQINWLAQFAMRINNNLNWRDWPQFADPIEWDINSSYGAYTIVLHNGDSYTSLQDVPKGIDISNEEYWVKIGDYNAQIEQFRQEVIKDKQCLLCVSTTSEAGIKPYQYAVSFDGGVSWQEIRESLNFAGSPYLGTDVQVFPYGNGLFLVVTSCSAPNNIDARVFYTEDFETYSMQEIDFGFIRLSKQLTGSSLDKDSYVWAPNIIEENDKLYLTASISTQVYDENETDVYYINTVRHLYIYAVEITIDNGLINKAGDLFRINLPANRTSVMDGSFYYIDGVMYCAYKDRIYDVINIAKANSITSPFTDVITCVDNMVGLEAPYFMKINDTLALFNTNYFFDYNQMHYFDSSKDALSSTQFIGCINKLVGNRMRNPYPCILSGNLAENFFKKYSVKKIPTKFNFFKTKDQIANSLYAVASQVIYESDYNKWLELKEWVYIKVSERTGFNKLYLNKLPEHCILIDVPGNKTAEIYIYNNATDPIIIENNSSSVQQYALFNNNKISHITNRRQIIQKRISLNYNINLVIDSYDNVISYYINGTTNARLTHGTLLGTIDNAYTPGTIFRIPFAITANNFNGFIEINPNGNITYYGDEIPNSTFIINRGLTYF